MPIIVCIFQATDHRRLGTHSLCELSLRKTRLLTQTANIIGDLRVGVLVFELLNFLWIISNVLVVNTLEREATTTTNSSGQSGNGFTKRCA